MWRLLLLLVVVGCGDLTGFDPDDLPGLYDLRTLNGEELPAPNRNGSTATSGTLRFNADGTYRIETVVDGGNGPWTERDYGSYTVADDGGVTLTSGLYFTDQEPEVREGTAAKDGVRLVYFGDLHAYVKF